MSCDCTKCIKYRANKIKMCFFLIVCLLKTFNGKLFDDTADIKELSNQRIEKV